MAASDTPCRHNRTAQHERLSAVTCHGLCNQGKPSTTIVGMQQCKAVARSADKNRLCSARDRQLAHTMLTASIWLCTCVCMWESSNPLPAHRLVDGAGDGHMLASAGLP
jgi:hypothetical protein